MLPVDRVRAPLKKAGLWLLDSYAPQCCIFCDQPSDRPEAICDVCRSEFRANDAACPRCALPDCGSALCPQCLRHPMPLARIAAPFVYDPAVAFLMRRWKYEKTRKIADIAALLLLTTPIPTEPNTIFLAVPLHWSRQLRRGFNHSQDLLDALRERHAPLRPCGDGGVRLLRTRATPKQSLASRDARLGNLDGAFRLRGDVAGQSVVLIDDVCTTGATATAIARTLLAGGAASVGLWCLARTPRAPPGARRPASP